MFSENKFTFKIEELSREDLIELVKKQFDKIEKLEEEKLFIGVSRSPVDLKKGVLILDGTLRDFTPKDWYKQLVKTGKIVVDIRFVDKANNNVIAEAAFEG